MEREYPETTLPDVFQLVTSIIDQLSAIEPDAAATTSNTTRDEGGHNPLSSLPSDTLSNVKPLLLTLHCLFPNELLLALDILDKRLVRRSRITSTAGSREWGLEQQEEDEDEDHKRRHDIYFVRSQSTLSSSSSSSLTTGDKFYEVHLHSWNCTCAAFTLAMVRGSDCHDSNDEDDEYAGPEDTADVPAPFASGTTASWSFGGTLTTINYSERVKGARDEASSSSRGTPSPVCCKHLLACVLAARCPRLFRGGVVEVDFELDEATSRSTGNGKMYEVAAWHAGWAG